MRWEFLNLIKLSLCVCVCVLVCESFLFHHCSGKRAPGRLKAGLPHAWRGERQTHRIGTQTRMQRDIMGNNFIPNGAFRVIDQDRP